MQVTIRGVRYDTEKADLIGAGQASCADKGSPEWWQADLYQKSGHYFLAGKGNSMTLFKGESRIIRLTPQQAKVWGSWFMEPKDYKQHFAGRK